MYSVPFTQLASSSELLAPGIITQESLNHFPDHHVALLPLDMDSVLVHCL